MSEDFESSAPSYGGRTPYLPQFFGVLARELNLGPQSHVLDIACGRGELAVGISPYVGRVFAIDESPAMIEEANSRPKINIEYFNARIEDLTGAQYKNASAILVGRALRYLPRDKALKFFENVLPVGAAIVACTSAIPNAVPWRGTFDEVRAKYGYRKGTQNFRESDYFSNTRFVFSNTPIVRAETSFTLESLLKNALSFRSISELPADKLSDFEKDLADALQPYLNENGEYAGLIQTAGAIFRKT